MSATFRCLPSLLSRAFTISKSGLDVISHAPKHSLMPRVQILLFGLRMRSIQLSWVQCVYTKFLISKVFI